MQRRRLHLDPSPLLLTFTFGRVFLFFHLQRPPLCGWSEIASQVALTYAASVIVGPAAKPAGRPDLIRSPKRVLAHLWEEDSRL